MPAFFQRALSIILLFPLVLSGVLATPLPVQAAGITVNTTADENGTTINTAKCSLREAIIAVNNPLLNGFGGCPKASGVGDLIILGENTYTLTIPGFDEDEGYTGDLDIKRAVTVVGAGPDKTRIVGENSWEDRIFHVNSTSPVAFNGLTIGNGNVPLDARNLTGGGILNDKNSQLSISNVVFSNNQSADSGGGLANFTGGVVTVHSSTFSGNTAKYGGAIYSSGWVNIYYSLFDMNTGTIVGGAIDQTNNTMTIMNSTITRNSSALGSALANGKNVILQNVTVVGNTGGPALHLYTAGQFTFKNTIIAGHANGNCTFADSSPIVNKTNGYNIEDKNQCKLADVSDPLNPTTPTNLVNTAPGLDPNLADNGGPTLTYALATGSPALDRVPIANCQGFDQRLMGRVGQYCDVGAYEDGAIELLKVFLPAITR